jgi:hypothetical protein
VHEGSRHILFATDPLLDATIAWEVVKKCDQEAIDAFLDRIRAMGFSPEVVITDGSPLYKQSLLERWAEVEHQLCIFHVLAKINEDVLKAARGFRDALPRPKRYRRGASGALPGLPGASGDRILRGASGDRILISVIPSVSPRACVFWGPSRSDRRSREACHAGMIRPFAAESRDSHPFPPKRSVVPGVLGALGGGRR